MINTSVFIIVQIFALFSLFLAGYELIVLVEGNIQLHYRTAYMPCINQQMRSIK